jgi:hypothetical protein
MTRSVDIPHGPIALGYSLGGFLPQVGLHSRGGLFYQESSYSHLWLAVPFMVAGIIIIFLPLGGYPKAVFAGFFSITAICGAAPYFVRNRLGQTIIVDPGRRTVCIKKSAEERTISWSEIAALQLCRQEKLQPSNQEGPSCNYQVNLVWRCAGGAYERHCLATHEVKRYILSLARRYESLLSVRLTDETNSSQPEH